MAEAARQGVHKVIWLTMRTADVSYVSPGYRSSSSTFRDNNRILLQKAQQYGGALQIADWATYSADQPSWVGPDGVHLSVRGAPIAAAYIADIAAQVLDGTTITPPAAPVGFGPAVASPWPGPDLGLRRRRPTTALYINDFDGAAWSGYASLGGIITSTPAAVSPSPGILDVFVRGADYALWTRHFDGASWWPWISLGGYLRSAPAVTSRSPGTIDVFAVGADRALWTTSFDGSNWSGWASLGGIVTAAPSATSARTGTVTVVARGVDNALWLQLVGRLVERLVDARRSPDGCARECSRWSVGPIDVFARGIDNALWTNRFDGGWSGWWPARWHRQQPAGRGLVSNLGSVAVFVRGVDSALWGKVDDGSGFGGWVSLGGILR